MPVIWVSVPVSSSKVRRGVFGSALTPGKPGPAPRDAGGFPKGPVDPCPWKSGCLPFPVYGETPARSMGGGYRPAPVDS